MAENRKIVKYRKPFHLNIGIVIFAIILIYVFFNMFSYLTEKHINIYQVKQGTIAENNTYQGLILRNETVYHSEFSGYLNYYMSDNTKAGWNNLIYSVDETGDVNAQMTKTIQSDTDINSSYFKDLKSYVEQFEQSYRPSAFYHVYDFKESVAAQITEAMNQSSLADVSEQVANANDTFHLVYAAQPGVLAYYTDGYEGMTLDNFDPKTIQALDYQKNVVMNDSKIEAGDPVYKQITSEEWNVIFKISDSVYEKLKDDSVVQIKFKKDNTACWVNYELREIDGEPYMVLFLRNNMIRFAADRYIDLELLLEEQSGLKIPNTAVTDKPFFLIPKEYFSKGGDSNSLGLNVVDEKNHQVAFVPTTLYKITDTAYYVSEEPLQAGTKIRRPDSTEEFEINTQEKLQGVYNVNKGYAAFRIIDVLYQSKEYTIIRTGTDFGVSLYDHIALEGSDVIEGDLVN